MEAKLADMGIVGEETDERGRESERLDMPSGDADRVKLDEGRL